MSKRLRALVMAAGISAFLAAPLRAEAPAANIGKKAAAFALKDTQGRTVGLADFKDRKAVVVVFIGTECPINNAFMPRLAELHQEFAPRGVQFLAVNSNVQDTGERVAEHVRKYGIPFPVLKDEGSRVADGFGAERNPEAFVLDVAGVIRYQGRIDDQFGVGYKRPKPTRRDLAEALNEVLAGKSATQARTPVAGCLIGRAKKAGTAGAITFTKDIAPILQRNCQECHRPGQIGPMPLLTYRDAAAWADTIREVVQEQRMPPWFADPRYGRWSNDRRLSQADRDTLLAWVDQGAPKGDGKDLPPPRQFVEGWRIDKPDVIISMPREYAVPADTPRGGIPYQYFTVETGFTEDRWVEQAEAREGSPEVVHHIVVFVVPPGRRFNPEDPNISVLCGTAPGDMPLILHPGTAKKVPAGSRLVFQMHYTPSGRAQNDRSYIGLVFAKKHPERRVLTEPIANLFVHIPPGADNHKIESEFTFKDDAHIIGFMPHMHLRGKDFLYEAIYPDGKKEVLLSVPSYNFNWQSAYRYDQPRAMPKGTRIHCVAHYDNSAKNPNNPDPTKRVFWGDQTWEEMMIGWMDYVYDRPAQ